MRVAAWIAVASLLAAVSASAEPSFLIQASASFQRLGPYRISADATYRGALKALGPSSSCRLRYRDPTNAVATWAHMGVRIVLITYGGVPPGKNGCTAPGRIHVHTARATGRRWYTSLGLRVGDSTARLRRLYPRARRTSGARGWYGRGFWLVTHRTGCIGLCGGKLFVTAPRLVAEVRDERVSAFVLVVGAEGD